MPKPFMAAHMHSGHQVGAPCSRSACEDALDPPLWFMSSERRKAHLRGPPALLHIHAHSSAIMKTLLNRPRTGNCSPLKNKTRTDTNIAQTQTQNKNKRRHKHDAQTRDILPHTHTRR
jgi:hypothetical protein